MIQNYSRRVKETIDSYGNIIVSYSFEFFEATPNEGFIKGSALFIDGSLLRFFEYVVISGMGTIKKLKYRYHYEDPNGALIFRYDNAPHHRRLRTFPHHKHIGDKVVESHEPSLDNVLKEIAENVLLSKK